jgi:hypothetical protein
LFVNGARKSEQNRRMSARWVSRRTKKVVRLLGVAAAFADRRGGVGAESFGNQDAVADADRVQGRGVEGRCPTFDCLFDGDLGLDEQVGQLVGPALVPHHSHALEFSQVVGKMQNSP